MKDVIFKYERPGIAVDVVLFAIINNDLKVGLIKREDEPYHGKHALPGRFVRYDEKIEDTAKKALEIKGNIDQSDILLEQLYTFGQDLERDTRIRTISIVYFALVDFEKIKRQEGNKLLFESVHRLPPMGFDHKSIINFALERLRNDIWTSDFAAALMPKEFTLTELQRAYEIILNQNLDKRNFRKKILEMNILKKISRTKREGPHRPAQIYSFKS